jgi:hypothetical protein
MTDSGHADRRKRLAAKVCRWKDDGQQKLSVRREISTDKRACVQRTITDYRLSRNGFVGSAEKRFSRSGESQIAPAESPAFDRIAFA